MAHFLLGLSIAKSMPFTIIIVRIIKSPKLASTKFKEE